MVEPKPAPSGNSDERSETAENGAMVARMVASSAADRVAAAVASEELMARFASRVGEPDANGCRRWTGTTWHTGYGCIKHRSHAIGAHQIAFYAANGFLPEVVMHACDNRPCVEPSHLSPGTLALNNADRQAKGRQARGERHGSAKLTASVIAEARDLRAGGMSYRKLGERFGVSHTTIRDAIVGDTWTVAA